jgi:hypothetical protein
MWFECEAAEIGEEGSRCFEENKETRKLQCAKANGEWRIGFIPVDD